MAHARRTIFTTWQWITMLGTVGSVLLVAGVSVTVFAFTTFEQKSDLRDVLEGMSKRLDRIEQKLDRR